MLITLEGIDGSGKTSQLDPLARYLESLGHTVVKTREPGATLIGSRIRALLLDPDSSAMAPLCELLLYYADRAQHLHEIIRPALESGRTVVCDRFFDATLVYQGAARGLAVQQIGLLQRLVVRELKPDLTLLFDLDPETGLARTQNALDSGDRMEAESRFEKEKLDFHQQVRKGYLDLAGKEPERFVIVDASLSLEEVFGKIKNIIDVFSSR